jgi:hypothetical protein
MPSRRHRIAALVGLAVGVAAVGCGNKGDAECLTLARQTSESRVRTSLLEKAQKRLDLAELCEHDAWNESLRLRALQVAVGQELRAQHKLPQELTHQILTLLLQLNAPQDATDQVADMKLAEGIDAHHEPRATHRGEDQKTTRNAVSAGGLVIVPMLERDN